MSESSYLTDRQDDQSNEESTWHSFAKQSSEKEDVAHFVTLEEWGAVDVADPAYEDVSKSEAAATIWHDCQNEQPDDAESQRTIIAVIDKIEGCYEIKPESLVGTGVEHDDKDLTLIDPPTLSSPTDSFFDFESQTSDITAAEINTGNPTDGLVTQESESRTVNQHCEALDQQQLGNGASRYHREEDFCTPEFQDDDKLRDTPEGDNIQTQAVTTPKSVTQKIVESASDCENEAISDLTGDVSKWDSKRIWRLFECTKNSAAFHINQYLNFQNKTASDLGWTVSYAMEKIEENPELITDEVWRLKVARDSLLHELGILEDLIGYLQERSDASGSSKWTALAISIAYQSWKPTSEECKKAIQMLHSHVEADRLDESYRLALESSIFARFWWSNHLSRSDLSSNFDINSRKQIDM